MMLKDNIRQWLMHLPATSVSSWLELYDKFVGAFKGCYQQPKTIGDLHQVV